MRPAGAVGGLVSPVTVAVAWVEGGLRVPGRVLGRDAVVVGARGEARVGERGSGRLCDPVRRARREAVRGRAVHVVADDAHVVARGAPGERDRAQRACRGEPGRGRRRARVARDDCARLARRGADVPRRVLGRDPVVVRAGRERAVREGRGGRLADAVGRARREALRGRAVDVVADDADVVARARPGERDRADRADRREVRGRGRRPGVRVHDRLVHVRLDLGRGQHAAVDAHLVDLAVEPLGPDVVAADPQRSRRVRQVSHRRLWSRPGVPFT